MVKSAQVIQLDHWHHVVSTIVLSKQNPCTGLIPASVAVTTHGDYRDAWVRLVLSVVRLEAYSRNRDNVYSIFCVYGLALAYKRMDDEDGRACKLETRTFFNRD